MSYYLNTLKGRSIVVLLTPTEAKRMREEKVFPRQREINRGNMQRLAYEITLDRFIPCLQIFIVRLPDGREMVVNGNHTLEAIISTGMALTVTITTIEASFDQACYIYSVFDSQKVRTWTDSLRAHGKDEYGRNSRLILTCLGVIQDDFKYSPKYGKGAAPKIERINMLDEWTIGIAHYQELLQLVTLETNSFVRLAPLGGLIIAILQSQPSTGMEFWSMFARDDGLREGMPARALIQFLRNMRNSHSGFSGSTSYRNAVFRSGAQAWNSFFLGEDRKLCRPGGWTDFHILGTPWEHGHLNRDEEEEEIEAKVTRNDRRDDHQPGARR